MDDGNIDSVEVVDDNLDDFASNFFGHKVVDDGEVDESVDEVDNQDEEEPDNHVEADADAEDDGDTDADDETDGEESEDDESDDEEPEEKHHKNRKSAKERISELARERREERQRANAAEAALEDLRARLAKLENPAPEAPKAKAPVSASDEDIYPDPDIVDDSGELVYPLGKLDPKYQADVVRNALAKEFEHRQAEMERQAKAQEQQSAQAALVQEWQGKLTEAEKDVPDLRVKIAELEDTFADLEPETGIFLAETIMTMERGVEVLNYLADNIGEAEDIVALSPRKAVIALGRIEGRLSSKKAKEGSKPKVSSAPKPPVATRGTGVAKRVRADTDDLEAFEREFFRKK